MQQDTYWERNRPVDWDSISAFEQKELRDGERDIRQIWDTDYFEQIGAIIFVRSRAC